MNWMQLERLLETEDRCVIPLGCTEQHAYISLATDSILASRVAEESAEPLRVPVYPVMNYGITPSFMAYPGTVSLTHETLAAVVTEVISAIVSHGFRRIVIVNGHGGNAPVEADVMRWADGRRASASKPMHVKWHNWWAAPGVMQRVRAIDPDSSHASWMENFPWTRLDGVEVPAGGKPRIDYEHYKALDSAGVRTYLEEGSFGGHFQRTREDEERIWAVAIEETRALIESGWE